MIISKIALHGKIIIIIGSNGLIGNSIETEIVDQLKIDNNMIIRYFCHHSDSNTIINKMIKDIINANYVSKKSAKCIQLIYACGAGGFNLSSTESEEQIKLYQSFVEIVRQFDREVSMKVVLISSAGAKMSKIKITISF